MGEHGPLENVEIWTEEPFRAMGTCPSCGLRARIDQDQYEGKVSVDCPECPYHETNDHRATPTSEVKDG